ncbi:AraC-like DNA-binding protein [Naumannella cuiyingiana]|uniref:AraC-like DNA-binding protein n=1 Tax=Naumannella cuiyingiana TaxID=1347891 RepID=A0A7Z0D932_9ACTN|nr:AraC-like DNA-binding protein [Naumannella cuiyingiana]
MIVYDVRVDALTSMLDHLRSSGALVGTNILTPPWAIRFEDTAPLTIISMIRGESWLIPATVGPGDDGSPVRLLRGDLAVISGHAPFTVTSDPEAGIEPLYVLNDPTTCTDGSGRVLDPGELMLGVRSCGARLDGEHAMLAATYRTTGAAAERVLSALPRLVLVPQSGQSTPLRLIEDEIARDQPGQQAVLDRLLDLLLVATLRDWFALPETDTPAWYRAMSDPVVGPTLRAIHDRPSAPWTVETLAREANVSRAAYARRFAGLLNEAPIAYLTGWRLCLAADLLRDTDDTVESVARQVGYANAFALSAAFARQFGHRPTEHRRLANGA